MGRRKAVGSTVGAVFLILIFVTGYSYMNYYFRQISSFADLTSETHEIDILRNTEDLSIVSANILVGDVLNLTVRNHGSYPSHICWMGLFDELSNTQEYYSIDFSIDPGDTITDILNSSAMIPDGEERLIQLVTDYGNLLTYRYPSDFIGGNGDNQQSSVFITCMGQPFNPVWYQLQGSTIYNSGSMSDMIRDNQSYFVVNSYAIGGMSNIEDYVDLQSNVDGSPDIGTHNIFSDLTIGPDGILDILLEEDTSSGGPLNPPQYESYEAASSSNNVNQLVVNKPSGTVQGDLLFAVFSKDSNVGILSSPTGWIDLREGSTGASRILVSYKIASASEPSTYTFTSTDSDQMSIGVTRFSGVDTTTPIDVYSTLNTGTSNSPTCPSITTTVPNTLILRVMGADDDDYVEPNNYPGGTTDIFSAQSTGSNGETHCALAYSVQSGIGSTGNAGYTMTASEQWGAVTVALQPPSSTSNYELDVELQWSNVIYTENNEELAIFTQLNRYSFDAQGGYMVIGDGSPSWGSTVGTISYWVKWDSVANRPWGQDENMEFRVSGSNLLLDWGNTDSIISSTSFIQDKWYFIAVTWNENTDDLTLYVGDETTSPSVDTYIPAWTDTVSTLGVLDNNFMASKGGLNPLDGHGDDLRYWGIDRSQAELQTDYMQVLGGSEPNLRSYYPLDGNFIDVGPDGNDGSGQGAYSFNSDSPYGSSSEDLCVDVWDGDSWELVLPTLNGGWNNVSVSSYLSSQTFTARLRDTDSSGDGSQDSWYIDAVLIHTWSTAGQQIAEIEFNGTSNVESWTNLKWSVDCAFDTGDVNVIMQLYNYTAGQFSTSGDGYHTFLSDAIPDTDNFYNQTILNESEHFRDASGSWKIKVKAEKNSGVPYQMKFDWVEFKPRFEGSGTNIQYDYWQEYRVHSLTWQGEPLSYGSVSIFLNGSNPSLRDVDTGAPLTNPCWVHLDGNGEYYFEVKSANPTEEVIFLKSVVGSIMEKLYITQQYP